MPSKWIEHIKEFAKSNNMSYKDALKDPKCKSSYHSGKGIMVEEGINKNPRGRPKKYTTPEEAKIAKSVKTMESNTRKKIDKMAGRGGRSSRVAVQDTEMGSVSSGASEPETAEEEAKREAKEKKKKLQEEAYIRAKAGEEERKKKAFEDKYGKPDYRELDRIKGTDKIIMSGLASDESEDAVAKREQAERKAKEKAERESKKAGGARVKKGRGVNVGFTAENANGLGHIYPISHQAVLQMLSCCPKK